MNIRTTFPASSIRHPAPASPQGYRIKFNPRAEILDEVVAGLLWMALDLPQDVSRPELEGFAHRLVSCIRIGASEATVERVIVGLQCGQLGRPANPPAIHRLAGRVMDVVRNS
jgi:hypothetical protein